MFISSPFLKPYFEQKPPQDTRWLCLLLVAGSIGANWFFLRSILIFLLTLSWSSPTWGVSLYGTGTAVLTNWLFQNKVLICSICLLSWYKYYFCGQFQVKNDVTTCLRIAWIFNNLFSWGNMSLFQHTTGPTEILSKNFYFFYQFMSIHCSVQSRNTSEPLIDRASSWHDNLLSPDSHVET